MKKDRNNKHRQNEAIAPKDTPILCPPEALGRSFALRLFGILCRAFVIFFAAAGLCTLIISGVFRSISLGGIVWTCLITVFAAALFSLHPVTLGLAGAASLGVVIFRTVTDPFGAGGTIYRMIVAGYNATMVRLYERGIYAAANWRISVPTGGDDPVFLEHFCLLLSVLISLVFVACLIRRARAFIPAVLVVISLFPVFTMNFSVNNYAVMLLVAGVSGVILLCAHDRRYRMPIAHPSDGADVMLFVDQRPPEPTSPEQSAKERRALKKERKQQKRQAMYPTVEQELDDYFGSRKPKKKNKKKTVPTEEEAHERRLRKEYRKARAAVRRYDRATSQARAAIGGFSSAVLCFVAALILWIPAATVTRSFHTIDSIDRHVKVYRDYVTALLRGDEDAVEMYEYLQNIKEQAPHSTVAKPLEFDEILLMQLRSQHNTQIYIPTFLGVDYDGGAWQYFNDGQYLAYRELYDDDDMPAEKMFADFMSLMDHESEAKEIDFVTRYKNRREIGYMVGMLNIKRYNMQTSEAFLPRVYAPVYGIKQYFSNEPADIDYANAFDGLSVGKGFEEELAAYSLILYSPTHENTQAYVRRAELIAEYNKKYKYDRSYKEAQEYADFVYSTYLDGSDSAIVTDYLNQILQDLTTREIDVSGAEERNSKEAATYEKRHLLTMAIIDYLVLNHTYTRTPEAEVNAELDGVENFLDVTHEGYCVQFASAAALMLREYGIPVRFVEGYLGNDFEVDIYGNEGGRYKTSVRDSDAHAWIEVWYDGIGWVVYECTPPYYIDMYGDESETADKLKGDGPGQLPEVPVDPPLPPDDPIDPPLPPDDPDEPPIEPIDPPEDQLPGEPGEDAVDVKAILRIVAISIGCAAVLGLLTWLIARFILRAKRAAKQRKRLAEDIIAGAEHIFGQETDRANAAGKLVRQTLALLEMYGTPPTTGELKNEYAKRLSFAYEKVLGYPSEYGTDEAPTMTREHISTTKIGELMDAIAAEEFGYGMTAEDMKKLARFYLDLRAADRQFVRPGKRFILHYVKRTL